MHRPADREGRPLTPSGCSEVGAALPVCAAQRNTGMYASLGGTHSTAGGPPHPRYSADGPDQLTRVSLELKHNVNRQQRIGRKLLAVTQLQLLLALFIYRTSARNCSDRSLGGSADSSRIRSAEPCRRSSSLTPSVLSFRARAASTTRSRPPPASSPRRPRPSSRAPSSSSSTFARAASREEGRSRAARRRQAA